MNKTQRTCLAGLILTATLAIIFFLAGLEANQLTPATISMLLAFSFATVFIHDGE